MACLAVLTGVIVRVQFFRHRFEPGPIAEPGMRVAPGVQHTHHNRRLPLRHRRFRKHRRGQRVRPGPEHHRRAVHDWASEMYVVDANAGVPGEIHTPVSLRAPQPNPGQQELFIVLHFVDPPTVSVQNGFEGARRRDELAATHQAFAAPTGIVQQ